MDRAALRVVHTTTSISPEAGGPAYSIPRLCEMLREAGACVDLLTISTTGGDRRTTPHTSFPLKLLPEKLGNAPGMWQWIKKRAGNIDIIHSHNLWGMPSIYPDWAARRWAIPHVVSPRGTLTEFSMSIGSRVKKVHWPLVQRPALQRAVCFHATAASEIEDIRRLGFRQPVALLPIGADLPPPGSRPAVDSRVVLYLGRLHPEKGVADLIDSWALIEEKRPDWRLRLVGPDSIGYRSVLEQRVRQLRLQRVEFGDARFGAAKFDEFRAASLYVLPSPTENFGVSVAEALASETPAIANHGAPWRALIEEKCGWWIANGVGPLADTLFAATDVSFAERSEMGRRGRLFVERVLDWREIAHSMLDVYMWLLGRSERPGCIQLD